ncbi:transcription/translation regulatory transformer protein RfaH [Pseudidiomarina sp.]|uniref:transcription/translation regulatory transformer protein RfaH n=1 Tax=Pseudidiomarina sp. TaxID=2081707 RepID=UPI00299DB401|nr:transcription/translation regulatory transformer protein RfaH [Pseudidiomarina sp.]MDX1706513.1 transcription/translation regulatory transformer protein RfaH [Pseudidiomarina sp.]
MSNATANTSKWYVIRSKPRQERRALANLENQEITTFLPEITITKLRRGKRTPITEALFPGYLFVQLDDYEGKFYKIRSTYGVTKMITFGDQPATIPDALIEELKQINETSDSIKKTMSEAILQPGDQVQINDGPFAGFIAKIIELDGDSRCIVLLDWLQKEVRASFDYNQLRKA